MAHVRRRGGFFREPLLHFLLLGIGLFALHGWLNDTGALSTKTIVIDRGRIDQLAAGFALLHQRPPMADELQGLIDDAVKEEIFYREALAQGLDRDDVIVRRRLRQKLEFVSEDVDPIPEPTDAQLQAWLVAHPAQFAIASRYTFEQVFLDPTKRGASLQADAAGLLLQLRRGPIADVAAMGDPLLVAHTIDSAPATDVQAQFGAAFATTLGTLAPGTWQGPIASGYGVHLVRVIARDAGRTPALAEVRANVRTEWMHAQREAANARFYAGLRKQYDVRIAQPAARAAAVGADTVAELRP
jgi:hypothetical protein